MRNIRITLLAIALLALAAPAMASTNALGVAGDFNVFVFKDYTATYSDSQGRVAVGGSATFTGYSVASALTPASAGDGLVVGQNLTYTGGTVNGNVRVGGTSNLSGVTVNGASYNDLPFDFATEESYLKGLSTSLTSATANGATTYYSWGGISLTGDGSSSQQVFTLDGAALLNANTLSLGGVGSADTVIINVSGLASGFTSMGFSGFAGLSDNIIFNFYEATTLTLAGIGAYGSVLAPLANVEGTNGNLEGTLIANSFEGSLEFHASTFDGDLKTPIPAAAWLLGTGLLGLVGLRRRFHA